MTTSSVCRIVVDSHERGSGVPAFLQALGAEVLVAALAAGDYDLGNGVLVERKTVPDLHHALLRGRLWPQIGAMRQNGRWPYLLIEGRRLTSRYRIHPNATRGACLAVMAQGLPIIFSDGAADSAQWLWLLARRTDRRRRYRPAYAQSLKPSTARAGEAVLASVPGISACTASALIDRFGSIRGLIEAGADQWLDVRGIGRRRAEALMRALT